MEAQIWSPGGPRPDPAWSMYKGPVLVSDLREVWRWGRHLGIEEAARGSGQRWVPRESLHGGVSRLL